MPRPIRLAYLTSHPIQYQAPLFRALAREPGVAFEALFCNLHGLAPSFDSGFGRVVKFDTPLLEGYSHRVLSNWAPRPGLKPTGLFNPGAAALAHAGVFDAIIVHGYAYLTHLAVLGSPRVRRARLLLRGESHGLEARARWKQFGKRYVMPALLRRADHFLAVGTLNRQYYLDYGIESDRITLAPYIVDNEFFERRAAQAAARRYEVRRSLGLPETGPIFLSCSKLTSIKRPADILAAFSSSCRGTPAHLAFAGDGPLMAELREQVQTLGVTSQVTFLGFKNQSELPEVYTAADALVLASEREPWGLVVNEAMACGLAVAVSDRVGCAPDLISRNGAVFPVGDRVALGMILRRWVDRPEVLAEMQEYSKEAIGRWGIPAAVAGVMAGVESALRA